MAEPIIELIALTLVERLEAITLSNGYPFDVTAVNRPTRRMTDITPEHLAVFVSQGDAIRVEEHDLPGSPPAVAYKTGFQVYGFIRQSDLDDLAYDQEVNRMQASIHQAICPDASWYTFGGNALYCELGDATRFPVTDGAHQGVIVNVDVFYRFSETDPSEAR